MVIKSIGIKHNNLKLIYDNILFSLFIFLFISLLFLNFSNSVFAQVLSESISLKANAGEDINVEEGRPVILNAEDSLTSNPPIDSYLWRQVDPKAPSIDLENSNTSRASFIAPNLPNDQYFVFQLIVKDENVTDIDTINVFVTEDLSSTNGETGGGFTFEPEKCFDGKDNDADGKIDLQDEECNQSSPYLSPFRDPNQLQQLPPELQQQSPRSIPQNPSQQLPDQFQERQGQLVPRQQPPLSEQQQDGRQNR